jgi:hypothetical protein
VHGKYSEVSCAHAESGAGRRCDRALPVSAEPGRLRAGVQVGGRGGPGQESQDRAAIASFSGARSAPAAAQALVSVAREICAPIRLTDLAARAQLSLATTAELVSDL